MSGDSECIPDLETMDAWSMSEIVAPPKQVLTGIRVHDIDCTVSCIVCSEVLAVGDRVTVYVHRPVEDAWWTVVRSYCPDCGPKTITTPTLGVAELLARARLYLENSVTQGSKQLCLRHVEVIAMSPPREGSGL